MAAIEADTFAFAWSAYRTAGAPPVASTTACETQNRLLEPAPRASLFWPASGPQAAPFVSLFGLGIANTTVARASRALVEDAAAGRRIRVVFANAHVINETAARPGYRATVASAGRILADGSGLGLAARLAGTPLVDNVNGTDLFPKLAADAAAGGVGIFLLGGRPGIAAAARRRMEGFGLGQSIVGTAHGYFDPSSAEEAAVIEAANASGARIVLVGMGVPLQDEWIAANANRFRAPVLVGVGGLFDYFAGTVSRAPHAFRLAGCEWVWRLALEPRRMARRYLLGNAVFLARAVAEAVRLRVATATAAHGQALSPAGQSAN